jgi:hypothetical protein
MNESDAARGSGPGRGNVTVTAIICALFVFVLVRGVDLMTSDHPAFSEGGDHMHYIAMAQEPGGVYQAPFCYRILTPALVRLMPFGTADSFYFLSLAFLVGTGVLVYYLVLETAGERGLALAAIALFYSLSAGPKFCIYDFWLTEPALFFFGTLSFYLLLRGHDIWLSIALTLAVLSKESALFILPLVYTLRARRPLDRGAALRAAAVAVLPVLAFIAVRLSIPSLDQPGPLELFRSIGIPRLTEGLAGFIRGGTVGTWGVLIPALVLLSGRKGAGMLLRALPFLVLVYMQPLFAGNVDRLLVLAFPAVLPVSIAGLRSARERFGLERWMTAGFVLLPFILVSIKRGYHPPSPEQQLAVLAGWTLIVLVYKKALA